MSKNIIYILFGVFAIIFFVNLYYNRKKAKKRKSRKFMDNYQDKEQ